MLKCYIVFTKKFTIATFGLDTQSGLFSHAYRNGQVPHPIGRTYNGV